MLREFFKFELGTQLRQPLLWVCALVLGALAFGATTTDAIQVGGSIGNVNRNAPVVVAQLLGGFSLISMFVVTIFIAGTVLRDSEVGISDMLFATPMKKHDYLVGRFGAGLVACLFIFAVIVLGMMLGPLMPSLPRQRLPVVPRRAGRAQPVLYRRPPDAAGLDYALDHAGVRRRAGLLRPVGRGRQVHFEPRQ
jgi:hypothetical protein